MPDVPSVRAAYLAATEKARSENTAHLAVKLGDKEVDLKTNAVCQLLGITEHTGSYKIFGEQNLLRDYKRTTLMPDAVVPTRGAFEAAMHGANQGVTKATSDRWCAALLNSGVNPGNLIDCNYQLQMLGVRRGPDDKCQLTAFDTQETFKICGDRDRMLLSQTTDYGVKVADAALPFAGQYLNAQSVCCDAPEKIFSVTKSVVSTLDADGDLQTGINAQPAVEDEALICTSYVGDGFFDATTAEAFAEDLIDQPLCQQAMIVAKANKNDLPNEDRYRDMQRHMQALMGNSGGLANTFKIYEAQKDNLGKHTSMISRLRGGPTKTEETVLRVLADDGSWPGGDAMTPADQSAIASISKACADCGLKDAVKYDNFDGYSRSDPPPNRLSVICIII